MLYIGADHQGLKLKEGLKNYLAKLGVAVIDCGAFTYDKNDDYVDFAFAVAKRMNTKKDFGLLVCGSGHGMVIAANKIKDVRAIMPLSVKSARDGRSDDHANVLVISAWEQNEQLARGVIREFLKTRPDKAKKYTRRLKKISRLEK